MANRYWVGGTGTWNTTSTTNWSATSGGAAGASVPTATDSVFFDQATTYTVTCTGAINCLDFTVSAGTVSIVQGTSPTLSIYGSFSLSTGTAFSVPPTFAATTTGKTIFVAAGISIGVTVNFIGVGGGWTLNSNVSGLGTLGLGAGTLTLNGYTWSTSTFNSTGTGVRSIAFGTGYIDISFNAGQLNMPNATNFTCTATTGGFKSSLPGAMTFTFGTTGGSSANAPNLYLYGGSAIPTLTTGSWFNVLDFTGNSSTPAAANLNVNALTLSTGGTFTSLNISMAGTGTVNANNKSIAALTINTAGTVTFSNAVSCTTYTHTAGNVDFASYNLTCSGAATFASGTLSNIGTISCTTWTVNGATFAFSQGTLNPSGGLAVTSGAFTYSGTAVLSPTVGISQSAGTVTFNKNYALSATGTYTLIGGALTVADNVTLSVGIFSSSGSTARSVAFGTTAAGNIALVHTTAATTVLSCATATNFTWSGPGGFTADASITRTYTFGTTGGTATNSPNLTLTGSGTAVQTFTTGSYFNKLDFGTTAFNPGTITLNLNNLVLSSGGTFSALNATMVGTGTITPNGNTTLSALTINSASGTTSLSAALTLAATGTVTLTSGTLALNGFNLTTGQFSSNNSNTRSISFGSNNVVLVHTTAATVVLSCAATTNFTWTGTGGFVSDASITRTYTFGVTNGSTTIAPNLSITSGAAAQTFTGGSWFNLLNFTGSSATATASSAVNVNSIILSATGTYTALNLTMTGTGTITNNGKAIAGFGVNTTGTATLSAPLSCLNYTQTAGTIDFASYNLTCASSATYTAGTLLNVATISCTSWTVSGTFVFSQGTINPSTNFIVTSGGSFTYNSGATLGASSGGFLQSLGNVTLNQAYTVSSYTLTQGTLSLNANLSTGSFLGSGSAFRNITFGTGTSVTVTGTGTVWDSSGTNISITGTPLVNVSNATATATTVNSGTFSEAQAINFNFTTGTYALTFLSTAGYTAGNVNFTGFAGTLIATDVCTVYGNYTLSTGMTVTGTSNTLTFGATSGTKTLTTNGKTMPPITFNGVGGTFVLNGNLISSGLVTVTGGTFDTTSNNYTIISTGFDSSTNTSIRSVKFNGSTVTLSGTTGISLDSTNLTFDAGTSQITLNNTSSTNIGGPGGVTFYNVSVTGGAPTLTVIGANTYNNLLFTNGTTEPSVVSITNNQTINKTLSNNNTSAIKRLQLQPTTFNGLPITITASAISLNDVDFNNITAAGAAGTFTGTRFGDLGGNSNITFATPKTVYWNLPAGGNWNSTAWATTVGGTPDVNNFPLAQDYVNIGTTGLNSTSTITVNANWNIGSLNFNASGSEIFATGTTSPTFYGTCKIVLAATKVTGTGTLNFASNATFPDAILWFSGGFTVPQNININALRYVTVANVAITQASTAQLILTNGIFQLGGFSFTTGTFSSNNSNTRQINFGPNFIYLTTATAGTLNLDMSTLTGFTSTGAGGFSATMNITRTFDSGITAHGSAANAPNLFLTSGASAPTINNCWFNLLDFTGNTSTILATVINSVSLTLATGGIYTGLIVNNYGGTITTNAKTIGPLNLLSGNPSFSALTCGVLTINGAAFNLNGGTLTPSSITVASGSFTYTSGTLAAVSLFTQTGGSVTFNGAYSLTATGTYILTSGSLTLGANLTVGTFGSNNQNTRSIAFGTNNIILATTTASATNLSMADITNFSYTSGGTLGSGTGCFQSTMSIARTFTCGNTAGGTNSNAPNLYLVSGTSVATITSNSWFNELNYGTCSFIQGGTTTNLNSLYATNSTATTSAVTFNMVGTGAIMPSTSSLGTIVINNTGTTLLQNTVICTTCTLTSGTVSINNLSCSGAFNYNGGTITVITTGLSCTTFTVNGATFNFSSGTITPSTSFVVTGGGSFTLSSPAVLAAVPTFTQTSGNVTINRGYALTATGTYTLTAGTLTVNSALTTGIFSSSGTGTRSIAFNTNNITLAHTSNATTVLSMADLTNFSWSGNYGFTADASVTRTFIVGSTASGSVSTAPNLTLTTGTAVATMTTGSWFNNLDFGTTSFTQAATTLNIAGNLTLSSTGAYTLTVNALGSGTITSNSKALQALTINTTGIITTNGLLTVTAATTLTQGTLNLLGNASLATLSSGGVLTKAITGNNTTLSITGTGATAFSNTDATLTVTGVTISMTAAGAKTFAGGSATYATLDQGGAGVLTVSGSNTFSNITNSYSATGATSVLFTAGATNTFGAFNLTGTVGKLCTLGSTTTAQTILKKPGVWYMGANSTNTSNNTNLTFANGGGINYLSVSYINGVVTTVLNTSNFFLMF